MASLHQMRCFLTTYEHGSLTAAAEELGYAQPSVSEQVRGLERSLGATLFRRVGRGVVPTTAADVLRPYAERAIAAADDAHRAIAAVTALETGTIRFGMIGTSRLYLASALIADLLERHPGVRVEMIGQNSVDVLEDLRRGRLEVAMIALPVAPEGLSVQPIARDELVYLSNDPDRVRKPVSAQHLADAELVLPETTWRDVDSTRTAVTQMVQQAGLKLRTRIEVEDAETAVELVGRGLADTVLPRGVVDQLVPRLAPDARSASLRPRLYDTLAIVHRAEATLSPAARVVIELVTRRIRSITEPINPPHEF